MVQETFRSAWKSRKLFRPDGGGRAWLASILRRRVADHWRRHRPPAVLGEDPRLEVETPPDDPYRDELTDEMQRALARLPVELRETLILVVVAELTHQEACEMLGVPLGTVLSRVSRCAGPAARVVDRRQGRGREAGDGTSEEEYLVLSTPYATCCRKHLRLGSKHQVLYLWPPAISNSMPS